MKSLSRVQLFGTPRIVACSRLLRPWDFLGKSTGVGCHFLLQWIFPTQGSNPGLPHCRQTLYHLSHQGSPWKTTHLFIKDAYPSRIYFKHVRKDTYELGIGEKNNMQEEPYPKPMVTIWLNHLQPNEKHSKKCHSLPHSWNCSLTLLAILGVSFFQIVL